MEIYNWFLSSKIRGFFGGLILTMLLPGLLFAQETGDVKGKVTSKEGSALSGVQVVIEKTDKKTVTDEFGNYTLNNVLVGEQEVTVTFRQFSNTKTIYVTKADVSLADFVVQVGHDEIESVLVSANRRNVPSSTLRLSENLLVTPQNIVVMDKSLFNDQMIFSTAEGFTRNVSGARTIYHQEEASAGIAVRGYSASNLRNGMDVSGSFGPLREDMAFVERIEFVKGPAGFMMGNTQPGGFYNIVTKKPKGDDAVNSARLSLGSFGLFRAEVDVDGKMSKDGKLLGRFNVMGTKKGSHVLYASNEQFVVNPSIKYILSDKTDFTAEYIFSQNAFTGGFSKYAYGINNFKELPREFNFSDPILDPTVVREQNVFGTVNHYFSDNWMLTGQFGYINSQMQGESLYAAFNTLKPNGDVKRNLSVGDAMNTSTVGQIFVKGKFNIGDVQNNILTGLDMGTKSYVADWTIVDTIPGTFNIYNPVYGQVRKSDLPEYDRSRSLRERGAMYLTEYSYYSMHFQDEAHFLNDKLRIGAGLRYTTTTRTSAASNGARVNNSALTPRFSITGLITPTFTAFALYDQTFQEQTGIRRDNGNPADPSRGISKELGLKKTWFNGNLFAGLTAYHLTRTNITTNAGPDFPGFIDQAGEATSKGIEVDVNGRISPSFNVMFNYAYTDARITKDNDPARVGMMLYGNAEHITNAWLHYDLVNGPLQGLGFSAGYEYHAKRAAWPSTKEKYLPDDLFSVDLGASFKRDNYHLALVVNNVLDRYNYTGFFPGAWGYSHYGWRALPPRGFRLTVGYTF